jgi:hypothetical protein
LVAFQERIKEEKLNKRILFYYLAD